MSQPRKVAIIGAGPSGLVAAKTLLHNAPEGAFAPVIFEKQPDIGGLWPTECPAAGKSATHRTVRGLIDPYMRTNLSRFTVSFSDLAWESVIDGEEIPMFPQAWQVGQYLVKYMQRYLPREVLRLGHEVLKVDRLTKDGSRPRWEVQWMETECAAQRSDIRSESFDFLIVASGYFSRPYIPDIPGLDGFTGKMVHSSALHTSDDIDHIGKDLAASGGRVVVTGASMSGVEAASALALHLSSMKLAAHARDTYEIHHVCSRPFWTVPYYVLPSPRSHFLPLDLAFYDLTRRPPGPIQYGFGRISGQQARKSNNYFRSLLGCNYECIGSVGVEPDNDKIDDIPPSWVAIGDDYAEYNRSGAITPRIGRISAIHGDQNGRGRLDIINENNNEVTSLDDVGAIVMATGFTPYGSLAFLPDDVLSKLEYTTSDSFIPVVLEEKGTTNAEIPDIGFVGFYRGPYWGVMEMQARSLTATWLRADSLEQGIRFSDEELKRRKDEREAVLHVRSADPRLNRSQFPMGDYVGLMESFARDLAIPCTPLSENGERSGPVIPARYLSITESMGHHEDHAEGTEADITLTALRDALCLDSQRHALATASAVFRALHGTWAFERIHSRYGINKKVLGTSVFRPRYPSLLDYEKEYVCEETEGEGTQQHTSRYIYRLIGSTPGCRDRQVFIVPANTTISPSVGLRFWHVPDAEQQGNDQGSLENEGLTVNATGHYLSESVHEGDSSHGYEYEYIFRFDGVVVTSWECTMREKERSRDPGDSYRDRKAQIKTIYIR